jgi:hypothetical protein
MLHLPSSIPSFPFVSRFACHHVNHFTRFPRFSFSLSSSFYFFLFLFVPPLSSYSSASIITIYHLLQSSSFPCFYFQSRPNLTLGSHSSSLPSSSHPSLSSTREEIEREREKMSGGSTPEGIVIIVDPPLTEEQSDNHLVAMRTAGEEPEGKLLGKSQRKSGPPGEIIILLR